MGTTNRTVDASLAHVERTLGVKLPPNFRRSMAALPMRQWVAWLHPVSSWTTLATDLDRDRLIELDAKLSSARGLVIGGDDFGDMACLLERNGILGETVWWWDHHARSFQRLAGHLDELPEVLERRAAQLLGEAGRPDADAGADAEQLPPSLV